MLDCRLLTKDPKKRPDARDALGHPWLKATGSKLALEGNDPYMQTISDEVARNLSKFAASNKLQRAFMHLAVTFIHKNEMQRMLAIFNRLNTDKHTPLPAEDITAILTKGRRPSEAEEISDTVAVRTPPGRPAAAEHLTPPASEAVHSTGLLSSAAPRPPPDPPPHIFGACRSTAQNEGPPPTFRMGPHCAAQQ